MIVFLRRQIVEERKALDLLLTRLEDDVAQALAHQQ